MHDFILTNQRDRNSFFRVIHAEDFPRITGDVKIFRHGICRHLQNLRLLLDPVYTEGPDIFFFMIVADEIVIITIPDERVRTDGISLPFISQNLFLSAVVINVLEGNSLTSIDILQNRYKA